MSDLLTDYLAALAAVVELRATLAPMLDGPWMDNTYPDRPQVCICCRRAQNTGHDPHCPVLSRGRLLGR